MLATTILPDKDIFEYPIEGYFRDAMVCRYTRVRIRSRS